MIGGAQLVEILQRLDVSHVIWIPDSEIGTWDKSLSSSKQPQLVRPTREGEAVALAAGLLLGGAKPLTIIQCTGLFEAGDSLRNFVHDLKLPLVLVVGVRSYNAHKAGRSLDTCPVFTEPILQAWRIPYQLLERDFSSQQFEEALKQVFDSGKAGAVLLAE
jgi:sulfopyruvate decarboxylase TPP-binding subunit